MTDTEVAGIVGGFLVALGTFLKNHTPLPNAWIPAVLVAIGVGATLGFTREWDSVAGWINGFMAGFAAIGLYEGSRSTSDAITGRSSAKMSDQPKPTS